MAWIFFSIVLMALTTTLSSGQNSSYSLGNNTQPIVINERGANDSISSGRRPIFTPQIPKECEKSMICENIPNYPQEHVHALLSKLSDMKSRFYLNKLSPDMPEMQPMDGEELCKSETRTIYPDAARTINGEWVFVVNGELKVQGFRVVLCVIYGKTWYCGHIRAFIMSSQSRPAFDLPGNRLAIADKYSVAYVTVPNTEVGKTIGHGLVKNKLAACVNIIPQVTSIYEWKDEINEDNEALLMIKTRTTQVDKLTDFVRANHPYEVCEVISLPIKNGNPPYLKWIGDSVPES